MAKCTTCYGLNRAKLFGFSTQRARHDCWILFKSLADLERAAQAGCEVCDVLSSGLAGAINTDDGATLGARDVQVEIMIPRPRHNRIRVIVPRASAARGANAILADLEFYGSSCCKCCSLPIIRLTQGLHSPITPPVIQNPWSEYKRGDVIPRGNFETYISTIRSWLQACTKSHPQCSSSSHTSRLPTRVLDLSITDDTVRIINTRTIKLLPYVALSYCWGNDSFPKTLSNTPLPKDHRISSLPSSFRDAILLTRALNTRYLWIDSLCILQDCRSDWETESSKMQQYYSGALLVLAASRAASPSVGFLHQRQPCEYVKPRHATPSPATTATNVICRRFSPHLASDQDRALSSPLQTRGWALQERLSASRIVHFEDSEMVWECNASTKCECGRLSEESRVLENGALPLKMRVYSQGVAASSGMSREDRFRAWADLVDHYTSCALTQDEDKIPAIGGLARIFASNSHGGFGRYIAGLWEGMLLPGLLWRVENAELVRRPLTYVAPSWSWASLVGRVDWKCVVDYRLRFLAQVLDCKTACSGKDAFGRAGRGMLRIRTRMWETQVEYQPVGGFMALTSGESAYFDVNGECRWKTYQLYQTVKCVAIAKGSSGPGIGRSVLLALVVRRSHVEGPTQRYERIGLAVLDPRRLESAVEETAIIV